MPAMKSMYSLPSSSTSVQPSPRAIATPAVRANDCSPGAMWRRSWATISRERGPTSRQIVRSEEHTSELQSPYDLVCRLLLEKKKNKQHTITSSKIYFPQYLYISLT